MKKFAVCALLLGMLIALASPVLAWDESKTKDLGRDGNNMQWWLLEYGKNAEGKNYAITRKYYTNAKIKNETIELLMSKFGTSPEVANSLYFTEYGYEYTDDGKQFALTYLTHYDRLGNEIHGTIYDDSSEATKKNFVGITGIPAKAATYVFGKKISAAPSTNSSSNSSSSTVSKKSNSSSSTSTAKKTTIPAKRIVRAKKK